MAFWNGKTTKQRASLSPPLSRYCITITQTEIEMDSWTKDLLFC